MLFSTAISNLGQETRSRGVKKLPKLAKVKASSKELQKGFVRQNGHLKGTRTWISIRIEGNYMGKTNPAINKTTGSELTAALQKQHRGVQTVTSGKDKSPLLARGQRKPLNLINAKEGNRTPLCAAHGLAPR